MIIINTELTLKKLIEGKRNNIFSNLQKFAKEKGKKVTVGTTWGISDKYGETIDMAVEFDANFIETLKLLGVTSDIIIPLPSNGGLEVRGVLQLETADGIFEVNYSEGIFDKTLDLWVYLETLRPKNTDKNKTFILTSLFESTPIILKALTQTDKANKLKKIISEWETREGYNSPAGGKWVYVSKDELEAFVNEAQLKVEDLQDRYLI